MTEPDEKLSAFLDGELSEEEARAIEDALARDPALQAELESLMAADALARDQFAAIADEPVPFELASAIRNAPMGGVANDVAPPRGMPGWLSAAAAVLLLLIGGAGGYFAGSSQTTRIAAAPGWLQDISEYHAVYSAEKRHLVEVSADEADHIVAWLTGSVGTEIRIPDLAGNGLTFRGARLLVAGGKPVAQLMYADAAGAVVALCIIRSETPASDVTTRMLNGFEMVSWGGNGANLVIVGDAGRSDLADIAAAAGADV